MINMEKVSLKGKAYGRESYLFKKKHPIRWHIRKWLKRLNRMINDSIRVDAR
jgi:hypothetical protein